MQTQDKYVSAIDKIKYYEALSKGRCEAERKFRSKAYSPTPYSNVSTPTQICSVNKAAFNANQHGIHTDGNKADTGPYSEVHDVQVMNGKCLTVRDYGRPEETVAEVVRGQMTEEVTEKCAEINDFVAANNTSSDKTDCFRQYNAAKVSEPGLVEKTGQHDVVIRPTDSKKDVSPEVTVTNSGGKPDNNADKEDVEACSDPVIASDTKDKIKMGTNIEQVDCKRKLPARSKLPVKAGNKDAKSTLQRELKYVKEHTKEASVETKQDERTIVSNYTNILNINKIYDEQMERQKNFEIQTDKQETEMELQLRQLCDILVSLKVKTKEIETMVGDFVDTITAFPDIKFEAESTKVLDIHSNKNNTDVLLKKNANVNKEIHDWLDEIKERRVVSLENLQLDIKKMNCFLELLKQNYKKYCKSGTFLREGNQLQPFSIRKMTKTTKMFQNQKPDLADICNDFDQDRKGNGNLDFQSRQESSVFDSEVQDIKICKSFRENCDQEDDKGCNFGNSINASLDLALSSSIKGGSKSKSQRNKSKSSIVRQRSEEKLVSSHRTKERKTKIPKPTWQAYQNVSRDRKQNGDLFESGDHSNTVNTESGDPGECNLTLQYEDANYCSLLTDNCTALGKNKTKYNSFRLNTKDVKAKIDTGLKTKSDGKIKSKSKNISYLFKTENNTLPDNVNPTSNI